MVYIIDTETTGLDQDKEIVEITINDYTELIKPSKDISLEALAVHHISKSKLKYAKPLINSYALTLLKKADKSTNYIVGHNINFDFESLKNSGFTFKKAKIIDTLTSVKHLFPDLKQHKLSYLIYALNLHKTTEFKARYGHQTVALHSSKEDVFITKLLFRFLKKHVGTITQLLTLSDTPIIVKVLKFGKYKDQNICDIATTNKNYLNWVLQNVLTLDENTKSAIKTCLETSTKSESES